MLLVNILLGFTSVVAFFLGLFIIISNPKKSENRVLSGFIFAILLWLLANLATNLSANEGQALFFAQSTFIGPILLSFLFFVFVRVFTAEKKVSLKSIAVTFLPAAVLLATTYTKYNIESIEAYGRNTKVGVAYTLLIPLILVYIGLGFTKLIRYYFKSKDSLKRAQIRYIFIGVIAALIPGIVINGVLPILGNYSASLYGPNVVILLAIFMTIAIVKHRLLDIRLIVARSLTYLCIFASVAVIYGVLIFGLGERFLPNSNLSLIERLFYVAFALLMAISYQPLKKFFDRVTDKVFFQDSYDSQEVLDQISSIIVGNVDPHKVQKGALSVLSEALRPGFMCFVFVDSSESLVQGDILGQQWSIHNKEELRNSLKHNGKKILIFDEIEEKNSKVKNILQIENISISLPLFTKNETIGYLIVGSKKSGNLYSSQDIGLLNIATNELAVALQNAQRFEEIQAFNITLQEKVTEATRELKNTNKKLVALDEAKDEFISMASHQLRTPLTSIKGYLSMLLEGDLGKVSDPQEKALKEAFGSSQRMVYLIADFLNVSRIKTGKFMIEPKEVDLPEMVREEITQLREMAGARDLTLEYEQPEVFPRVMLDDNKIRQVMMNMVDNAIYYTPTGGKITIQLYSTGDEIIFKVVDTGIGVPKHEQHKLFTKFYRAGNARKARPDGTGLGLFMAQKIVAEQGGAIIFESTEGKGSTFGWRFPLTKIKV